MILHRLSRLQDGVACVQALALGIAVVDTWGGDARQCAIEVW